MIARLPLEPLRAFVCAAQVASFRRAARLLHVTPGALSQRIAALEDHIGAPLFRRTPHGVELLSRGHELLSQVAEPLERIETALARQDDPAVLHVHTLASLANEWLIPRLGRFRDRHPSIDVEIEAGARLADIATGGSHADVAIRFGDGNFGKGLHAVDLFRPSAVLIAHPALLDRVDMDIASLLNTVPLLAERDPAEWDRWLKRFGVDRTAVHWGPLLDDDAAMISAVKAGQGIASVRDFYVRERVRDGSIRILARDPDPIKAYYLVGRRERLDRRDTQAFATWLVGEFRVTEMADS